MPEENARILREKRTMRAMVHLYCRAQHGCLQDLCSECQALLNYAMARLERCPFGPDKPTCANCTIHCYKPDMRQQVKIVMRYAGPRMLLHHPFLACMHLIDGRRKAPGLTGRIKKN
jgi:hypothetical protein